MEKSPIQLTEEQKALRKKAMNEKMQKEIEAFHAEYIPLSKKHGYDFMPIIETTPLGIKPKLIIVPKKKKDGENDNKTS